MMMSCYWRSAVVLLSAIGLVSFVCAEESLVELEPVHLEVVVLARPHGVEVAHLTHDYNKYFFSLDDPAHDYSSTHETSASSADPAHDYSSTHETSASSLLDGYEALSDDQLLLGDKVNTLVSKYPILFHKAWRVLLQGKKQQRIGLDMEVDSSAVVSASALARIKHITGQFVLEKNRHLELDATLQLNIGQLQTDDTKMDYFHHHQWLKTNQLYLVMHSNVIMLIYLNRY